MNIWIGILTVLYVFACLFLIFIILIQSGKGGGLSSLGASSQGLADTFGTTGAERMLNKITTACAAGFMIIAIMISALISRSTEERVLDDREAITAAPITQMGVSQGDVVDVTEGVVGEVVPSAPAAPDAGNTSQPAPEPQAN